MKKFDFFVKGILLLDTIIQVSSSVIEAVKEVRRAFSRSVGAAEDIHPEELSRLVVNPEASGVWRTPLIL